MTPGFWQSRRVLLTGHTDFKGARLALWLREFGARVAGYSLAPPARPNPYEAAGVGRSLAAEAIADIRDLAALSSFSGRFNLELIVHLAAQSLVYSKARTRLGWRPRLGLERGIEWTVDWYRSHLKAPDSARALCVEQIARFRSQAAA